LYALTASADTLENKSVFREISPEYKVSNMDWLSDISEERLLQKVKFFIENYQKCLLQPRYIQECPIKFSKNWIKRLAQKQILTLDKKNIQKTTVRPFEVLYFYEVPATDLLGFESPQSKLENNIPSLILTVPNATIPFQVWVTNLGLISSGTSQFYQIPLYTFNAKGQKKSNISEEVLSQFKIKYQTPQSENRHQLYLDWEKIWDYAEFYNCQVEPELAQVIREYVAFLETHPENQRLRKVFEEVWLELKPEYDPSMSNIQELQKKYDSYILNFHKLKNEFEKTARKFAQIGKKQCKSKESFEVFQGYFQQVELALNTMGRYFEWRMTTTGSEGELLDFIYADTEIDAESVFAYQTAVLHHPHYQQKYALNLQQQVPAIPLGSHFWIWVYWGRQIIEVQCTDSEPFALKIENHSPRQSSMKSYPCFDKESNEIRINPQNTIQNLPPQLVDKSPIFLASIEYLLRQIKEVIRKNPESEYDFQDFKKWETHFESFCKIIQVCVATHRIQAQLEKMEIA
jgi:predicted helicase